ncbi:MAG: hypothetical protein CMK72_11085 [Pseudomonadaceae bacterium]|uniref:hypothetical protein n=1 Tax=Pseudomonas sp. MS19 TaxID=2579939 RepID=UPI000C114691|nr:hypothetical protein [Pseudomonas sp. MS19]MBQ55434.1 hypothetical protein [Pseudomonadaceae bacterium]NRH26283.1 hypothetical protein [Pseudomonas sp. MS19]HCP57225.1 hypothetical protein [Pseudomonas sp.]
MQEQAILTKAEMAFIKRLYKPAKPVDQAPKEILVDGDGPLKTLLAAYANTAQLTIEAHFEGQRLTFTPQLVEDDQHVQHLELGTPQIFDDTNSTRSWRLPLTPAVELRLSNGKPSGLLVHEISMHGLLVEQRHKRTAPKTLNKLLPLPGDKPIAIHATRVRSTKKGMHAYSLEQLDHVSKERLQQYIYEKHRELFPQAHQV